MECKITVNNKDLVIIGENAELLTQSLEFRKYLDSLKNYLTIESINEEWSWFSKKGELIFAIIYVRYVDEAGKNKGEILFFRSDSVAVFLVVCDPKTPQKFAVLVEQVRIPAGGKILEAPAGSVEAHEDFVDTLAREIEEEVGMNIAKKDLEHLGTFYFSPGACNEKIALYCCELNFSSEKIQGLKDRLAGLRRHGEYITVRLVDLRDFDKFEINDAKTKLAYLLYLKKTEARGK